MLARYYKKQQQRYDRYYSLLYFFDQPQKCGLKRQKNFGTSGIFPIVLAQLTGNMYLYNVLAVQAQKILIIKTCTAVLKAVSDANLKFTYVSIGSAGRESDGGIFQNLDFGLAVTNGTLPLPPPNVLPGTNISLPAVFVGDAAFPLSQNLMRLYAATDLNPTTIFNYRLSRARRIVENAFGVLANKWRILRGAIIASPFLVDNIVKSCVVLHN